ANTLLLFFFILLLLSFVCLRRILGFLFLNETVSFLSWLLYSCCYYLSPLLGKFSSSEIHHLALAVAVVVVVSPAAVGIARSLLLSYCQLPYLPHAARRQPRHQEKERPRRRKEKYFLLLACSTRWSSSVLLKSFLLL
ncbi:hypothetical protein CSUI_003906, partial [Cystoisospora suis]